MQAQITTQVFLHAQLIGPAHSLVQYNIVPFARPAAPDRVVYTQLGSSRWWGDGDTPLRPWATIGRKLKLQIKLLSITRDMSHDES